MDVCVCVCVPNRARLHMQCLARRGSPPAVLSCCSMWVDLLGAQVPLACIDVALDLERRLSGAPAAGASVVATLDHTPC